MFTFSDSKKSPVCFGIIKLLRPPIFEAITHLPQIAGLADHHYEVKKTDDKIRTSSSIEKLTDEGRVREIAKLMSGEKVTKASIQGAQELMGINFNSK